MYRLILSAEIDCGTFVSIDVARDNKPGECVYRDICSVAIDCGIYVSIAFVVEKRLAILSLGICCPPKSIVRRVYRWKLGAKRD